MTRLPAVALSILATPLLGGCLAQAAVGIVTAPVKVAGKAVDLATTSQSEADENRGRAMRHNEEEAHKLERKYEKQMRRCQKGDRGACDDARDTQAKIERMLRR
ncbi:MAG: hypothetical protein RLZZ08_730 [Pseudomonadota bacterium]|jgi:hypothetical protein